MKIIPDLKLGFCDAENYRRSENHDLFNKIFVKNDFLEKLLQQSTYFLIGEKGTGKTAYAVYMANNDYKKTLSEIRFIRETDYQKFIELKRSKHLQLSDYTSIWKVVILLLIAKSIKQKDINSNPFSKIKKMNSLLAAIDEYYENAFSPEIINALVLVENSQCAAKIVHKHLQAGGEQSSTTTTNASNFQVNLLYIEKSFKDALSGIKLKGNHYLFIDGIDIRPSIPYEEYLECIKGLANALWDLNNDFFCNIKDSVGRMRCILLVRPDIFKSIGLQNMTNKIKDNSVYLDWRTTYSDYRTSQIFSLANRLFSAQQEKSMPNKAVCHWDYYCPWETNKYNRTDGSFVDFLKISYSRPRDLITFVLILQEQFNKRKRNNQYFIKEDFCNEDFRSSFSEYLLGSIQDQMAFYYDENEYSIFLKFFNFLNNSAEFSFDTYILAYNDFKRTILDKYNKAVAFCDSSEEFLQFLYDSNIISYIENTEKGPLYSWCYRERNYGNMSPKVKMKCSKYRIHYGLQKALNVGLPTSNY